MSDEKILLENSTDNIIEELEIDNIVDKLYKISHNDIGLMKEIILWLLVKDVIEIVITLLFVSI